MPVFDFDEGTTTQFVQNVPGTLNVTDGGINFTFSITSTDGASQLFEDALLDRIQIGAQTGVSDVFTLDVTGPGTGNTQFSGTSANPIVINATNVVGTWNVNFISAGGTVTQVLNGGAGSVSASGQFTEITFTPASAGNGHQLIIDSITTNINCFLEGTKVACVEGEVAVEALSPGDMLRKPDGSTTTVKWVARQDMHPRFQHPAKINPICIKAGALDDGVPRRDLFVTGEHALLIDGLLINASALVNGRTVFQVERMPLDGFTYYHIETDAHEAILAENTPAETFIDYAGRDEFDNAGEHPDPGTIPEMDAPRVSSARLVPAHVSTMLAERVQALSSSTAA